MLSAPCAEIPSITKNWKFKLSIKPNISNSKFGMPPNHNMTKNEPILLYESSLLIHLQPQRLELFSQHGRRAIKHARHRLPGGLRLLRPFPGHLDDKLVVITKRQSGHDSAALHSSRLRSGGGFARNTLAPKYNRDAPGFFRADGSPGNARHNTSRCVRKTISRSILAHSDGEPSSTALSTTVFNTPARSRISTSEF